MRKFSHVLLFILLPVFVMAQHTVSGTVTDAATGDALPGVVGLVLHHLLGRYVHRHAHDAPLRRSRSVPVRVATSSSANSSNPSAVIRATTG